MPTQALLVLYTASGAVVAYATWLLLAEIWQRLRSPLRRLQGPKSASWIYGNLGQLFNGDSGNLQNTWLDRYGTTFKIHAFFNVSLSALISSLVVAHPMVFSA
jgi:hypothetical protein